jgi:HD superfamily phosphohydrolase YqeK
MKPWEEFADAMEASQRLDEIERTADCIQRQLYQLIHMHAFKEVREILRHTKEYMEETIEVLQEDRETIEEQPSGFRATPHRHSA